MARNLLVAIMRDEGPYVIEWIAHHRALGFTDILVFTNDCSDSTDRILDRLMEMQLVLHAPNPKSVFGTLGVWQVAALRYASAFGIFRRADWVCTIDADEFIEIAAGDGTLSALFETAGECDVISLPVIGYRSDDRPDIGNGQVLSRFQTPRVSLDNPEGWVPQALAVKSLSRPGIPRAQFRNHRPKIDGFSTTGRKWLDGSGNAMPSEFTDRKVNGYLFPSYPRLGHVNHHSLRSLQGFMVKALRGDAVTASRLGVETKEQIDNAVRYWTSRNHSDLPKRDVHLPPRARELAAELHADPVLADLHGRAIEQHERMIERLLQSPAGQMLDQALRGKVAGQVTTT